VLNNPAVTNGGTKNTNFNNNIHLNNTNTGVKTFEHHESTHTDVHVDTHVNTNAVIHNNAVIQNNPVVHNNTMPPIAHGGGGPNIVHPNVGQVGGNPKDKKKP
jgi:hypothetical protein